MPSHDTKENTLDYWPDPEDTFDRFTHSAASAIEGSPRLQGIGIHARAAGVATNEFANRDHGRTYIDGLSSMLSPIVDWISPPHSNRRPVPLPLVGIETNPGPATKSKPVMPPPLAKLAQEIKQIEKAVHVGNKKKINSQPHKANQSDNAPAAHSKGFRTGKPKIRRTGTDSVYIEHTELITSVTGSVGWTTNQYAMQPGMSSVFTWLSTQTSGWERYKFKYLRAHYTTRTGSNTPGTLMLIPDYDPSDTAPVNETEASSFFGSSNDAPWKDVTVDFDMRHSKPYFVRQGPLAANQDLKETDYATLTIATQDGTAVGWGKVYLEYGVELIQSQAVIPSGIGGYINSGGSVSATKMFGTTPTTVPGSYMVTKVDGIGLQQQVQFQNLKSGNEYLLTVYATGTTYTQVTLTHTGMTLKSNVLNVVLAGSTGNIIVHTVVATSNINTLDIAIFAATVTGVQVLLCPFSQGPM